MGLETLAALAITLAGTGAGIAANQEEVSSENNATSNAVSQLQQLQKRATPVLQANEKQSTPQAAQDLVSSGKAATLGQYAQAAAAPLTTGSLPSGASSNVTNAETQARIGQGQQAGAANQGYTNLGQQWSLQDQSARNLLGNFAQQGQSVASALPAELAQAKNSQATLAGIGSLLQTAGLLGGTYAATQAPGGGGAATLGDGNSVVGGVGYGPTTFNPAYSYPMYNWANPGGYNTPNYSIDQ